MTSTSFYRRCRIKTSSKGHSGGEYGLYWVSGCPWGTTDGVSSHLLARWRILPRAERIAVIESAADAVVVSAQLRLQRFRAGRVDYTLPERRPPRAPVPPRRLARIVSSVSHRLPWDLNCLQRSLVLARLLSRRGMNPSLKLGVRREDSTLRFHAWIELAGTVVNDRPDIADHFTPFDSDLPPQGAAID
jgi:hypothetical protein